MHGSATNTIENFVIDIHKAQLVHGVDPEATQNHTFSIKMASASEPIFSERPHIHPNGTLVFTVTRHAVGRLFLDITITDDGDTFPISYAADGLGQLDHAGAKWESRGRNSSTQTVEVGVSDSLMRLRREPQPINASDVAEVLVDMASVLNISTELLRFDPINVYFVLAVGSLQDLLQVLQLLCM